MDMFSWFIPDLSQADWGKHGSIFFINLFLLLFSRPILSLLGSDHQNNSTLKIFRYLNIAVLILHVVDLALLRISSGYQHYFINVGFSLMAVYAALFVYSVLCYLSRKRFGIEKTIDEKVIFLDTYSSRLIGLLFLALTTVTTIYTLIKIWGADSMLETTGIFGIVAALIAFTSNIWAPDILGGLIILNTQMLEDGDVVIVDGYEDEYIISKVSLVYVLLYDVCNNHRTLIRNSEFVKTKIDNLSRIASTDGLRQPLVYNIGYPDFSGLTVDEKNESFKRFKARVERMFATAFNKGCEDKRIKVNADKGFEWFLTATGDFALEYTLWIYLERLPNTKITATIRRHLMGSVFLVNELVYEASVMEGIELATPTLSRVGLHKHKTA